ncbi:MAG: YncE family protein [Planctomycetes bacterium]|nr:YncE family protein [Planctomycetota bacterium]
MKKILLSLPALLFLLATNCAKEQSYLDPIAPFISVVTQPQSAQRGNVRFVYRIRYKDDERTHIVAQYSLDGVTWNTATEENHFESEGAQGIATSLAGANHVFVWDSIADLGLIGVVNVFFRILPVGNELGSVFMGPFLLDNRFEQDERAFVSLGTTTLIAVIDVNSMIVVDYIDVGLSPRGMAGYTAGGIEYLAVAVQGSKKIAIINLSNHDVEQFVSTGNVPTDVDFVDGSTQGDLLVVPNYNDDDVRVFRIDTGNVITNLGDVSVGDGPVGGAAFVSGGVHYYAVTNERGDSMHILDLDNGNNKVVSNRSVGDTPQEPVALTGTPWGDYVFVPNIGSDNVSINYESSASFLNVLDTPLVTEPAPSSLAAVNDFRGNIGTTMAFVGIQSDKKIQIFRYTASDPVAGIEDETLSPMTIEDAPRYLLAHETSSGQYLYITTLPESKFIAYRISDDPMTYLGSVSLPQTSGPQHIVIR